MNHMAIAEVSEFIRHLLWLGITADPDSRQLVSNEQNIVLSNPGQTALGQGVTRQLSLWLYQVTPSEHLRNAPATRRLDPQNPGNDDQRFFPPLGLNLLYLVTPSITVDGGASNDIADQQLLGRVMQILHDQSVVRMGSKQDPAQGDELHISVAPRTIEELAEVWEAMQQPYRLSVCYEVRSVRIESQRRVAGGRIGERVTGFANTVEV
jgi:hypothetical protein